MKRAILVNGVPASGKTTFADRLTRFLIAEGVAAVPLGLDIVKEALFAHLGAGNRDHNRMLGRASYQAIFDTESDAADAKARIEAGDADFDAVLAERGESRADTSLGDVTRADVAAATADAAFALLTEGVAGPVDTGFGFALIDVISPCVTFNNNPGSTKSYEFVREHAEATGTVDFVPMRREITTDYKPGFSHEVTMHDGSSIHLYKVDEELDPFNRRSAMMTLEDHNMYDPGP